MPVSCPTDELWGVTWRKYAQQKTVVLCRLETKRHRCSGSYHKYVYVLSLGKPMGNQKPMTVRVGQSCWRPLPCSVSRWCVNSGVAKANLVFLGSCCVSFRWMEWMSADTSMGGGGGYLWTKAFRRPKRVGPQVSCCRSSTALWVSWKELSAGESQIAERGNTGMLGSSEIFQWKNQKWIPKQNFDNE